MLARDLKKKFFDFFASKEHKQLPNVSLVPAETDNSVLFTTAGMHPLVRYLVGEPHSLGKRLYGVQRCIRTDDIENVGDGFHHTFFEMLGNWSLGDPASPDGVGQGGPASPSQGGYWKEEAIEWSWEFLTKIINMEPEKIFVSCFAGGTDASKDEESADLWKKVGVPSERIFFLGKKENWWGPVGQTGPCGPDTEIFYDTGKPACGPKCNVACQCGKYVEIWNNVFMQYNQKSGGKYEPLKQKNVDTGMGVERMVAVTSGYGDDDYKTELFQPIIKKVEEISGKPYEGNEKPMRIIADHLRAAVFLAADGVEPSNKDRGYILRRLVRRATYKMWQLPIIGSRENATRKICYEIVDIYSDDYPRLEEIKLGLDVALTQEVNKFEQILGAGVKFLNRFSNITAEIAFDVFQTHGLPPDVIQEVAEQKGQRVDKGKFDEMFRAHQEISRAGMDKKFSGGLADHSETVTKFHTATHLLHQALREVLGENVHQVGSNITPERLRFDFTYSEKMTDEQMRLVEEKVNAKIKENLSVTKDEMKLEEAKAQGALAFFAEKYGDKVSVYSIGDYSKEVCGGPHVKLTGEIGGIKIFKEESVGSGRRRIYIKLAHGSK